MSWHSSYAWKGKERSVIPQAGLVGFEKKITTASASFQAQDAKPQTSGVSSVMFIYLFIYSEVHLHCTAAAFFCWDQLLWAVIEFSEKGEDGKWTLGHSLDGHYVQSSTCISFLVLRVTENEALRKVLELYFHCLSLFCFVFFIYIYIALLVLHLGRVYLLNVSVRLVQISWPDRAW